jgi:uridine phosphorylase
MHRGLRITVGDVLALLASGMSREAILTDYPALEDADIDAVLDFAARQANSAVMAGPVPATHVFFLGRLVGLPKRLRFAANVGHIMACFWHPIEIQARATFANYIGLCC